MSKGNRVVIDDFDEIFDVGSGGIENISLEELHEFKNHPFRVADDEAMAELVESIKQNGVLVPIQVRKRAEGGYEILSGHRRCHAAKLAGCTEICAIVGDYDDDQATVIMVDANIQRENILISEKAKAYRMKYDAMKHQGSSGGSSLQEISEQSGEGYKTIQRLIKVADLKPELLDLMDTKKLGLRQGIDLSSLTEEQQKDVYEVITELGVSLSMDDSARIKEAGKKGYLGKDYLRDILTHDKPKVRKVVFNQKRLDNYFDPNMSNDDIEKLIVKLLDEWKQKGGQR